MRGDIAAQMLEVVESVGKDTGIMWLLDTKRHIDVDGFDRLASADPVLMKAFGAALFEHASTNCSFRTDKDIACVWDGRSSKTQAAIARHILKPGSQSKLLPSRPAVPLRLMHHNREFAAGGWARGRRQRSVTSLQ